MKQKRLTSLFLTLAMALALLVGCGTSTSEAQQPASSSAAESTVSAESASESTAIDENQAAAEQLLLDLNGTYQELWPVILSDEYKQLWLDDSAALVGEENAEAAVEKMTSMVTGTVTGEEAVEAYKDGNMAYDCAFLQDVAQFTFDGTTISGVDKDGNELFRHTYHYGKRFAVSTSTKVMMLTPASSPISAWHPTPWRPHSTSSSAMAAILTLLASTMQANMPIGWHPAFRWTAHRKTLKTASSFSARKICPHKD